MDATCSEATSSIYAERLLSGNQIRVLHIQPSPERDRQLECTLKLVSLDDAPVYEALSYVWGTDPPSVPIVYNGQRLNIRPELSYALVGLRLKNTTRIIWADALCINQDDNQEKSHQIPLMNKIYSQAAKVNIWLGRGDESVVKEVFECCRLVANACREFSLEHDMGLNGKETHEAVEVPLGIFTLTVCKGLTDLFHHPLFLRVWCIQEIKLAQHALVVWGEQYSPWAEVGLTASWIHRKKYSVADSNEASRNSLKEIDVGDVDVIYGLDLVNCSLLEVLHGFRRFQSTDPRDKVYGLIGLAGSPSDGGMMVPDYAKSTAQVFTDMALHIITSTKHLSVFTHVAHHANYDGDDGYRSWAPRWDIPQNTGFIGHAFLDSVCSGPEGEAQSVVTKHPEGEQLCLTGIIHAKVITIDSVFDIPVGRIAKSDGLEAYHQVAEVYEGIDWNDPMSDAALPVLARTLTENYTMRNSNTFGSESSRAHYEGFRRYLEWYRDPKAEFDGLSGDALQYHDEVSVFCDGLRFFRTSKKDYGIGPACMLEGDIVVVLYGGDTPFVLRPKGDKYLMLGEAYVDSIMNSEPMREVEEGKRRKQEFCLI